MKETNLRAVKEKAKALLYVDIQLTEYSPMIVQHPFTNSALVGVRGKEKGKIDLVNLLEGGEALEAWQNQVKESIESASNVFGVYWMISKPYSLLFVNFVKEYLSNEDFAKLLASAWVMEECPNMNKNFSKKKLVGLFRRADRKFLMDEDEVTMLDELDDTVTVYRGMTAYNKKNIRALSWTLDKSVAEWFAKRFGGKGVVYQAQIDKADILACFTGRNEAEIVLDPACLKLVQMCSDFRN